MIFNIIKHFVLALLLDAGAAMAFDVDLNAPAPTAVPVPAQSCAVPAPPTYSLDSGTQS